MTSPPRSSSEVPALEVEAHGEKDVGGREHDEDAVLVRGDLALFAVADGAGGENAGNVASSIALASLARHFEATAKSIKAGPLFDRLGIPMAARRLSSGIQRANKEVLEIARSSDRYRGMGTTIVALAPDLIASVVHVAHVGDSRCYRLRAGRLELVTQDHSLAQDVLELSPDIDDATSAKLPQNVITRALGMSETIRVSVRSLDLAVGDRFLLCSDGITDVLSDEEIAETLITAPSARESALAMVARAKAMPADDNVAVVIVKIEGAAGVVAVPKRHATRPHPSRPLEPTPRSGVPGDRWDDPEIIMVDDSEPPQPREQIVHMVPRNARAQMLDALQEVMVPRPRPRAASPPTALSPNSKSLEGPVAAVTAIVIDDADDGAADEAEDDVQTIVVGDDD